MSGEIKGVYVPVVTPIGKEEQELDLNALRANILKLNKTDVAGYMPLGSNGEFFMLSESEQLQVIQCVADNAAENKSVFAGAGRESVTETLRFIKEAAKYEIDAVFVLTPHYFPQKMDAAALERFFNEIADDAPVPVIIYNAPPYAAGVTVTPELMGRLACHPNIIGIKNTSAISDAAYVQAVRKAGDCAVLAGTFKSFWTALTEGAAGGVLSGANYLPDLYSKIYQKFTAGDMREAEELYVFLRSLTAETAGKYGVAGVKAAMDLMGFCGGVPRRPLLPVSESECAAMGELLQERLAGKEVWK